MRKASFVTDRAPSRKGKELDRLSICIKTGIDAIRISSRKYQLVFKMLSDFRSIFQFPNPMKVWKCFKPGLYLSVIYYLLMMQACHLGQNTVPADPNSRIEVESIYQDVEALTKMGPRVTGSEASEIEAVRYLSSKLESIKNKSLYPMDISCQTVSGSLSVHGNQILYQDIQNVVAKITLSMDPRAPSILLNCHFDSVPLSPGASDNAASCAIILKLVKIIATGDTGKKSNLHHNLIFLFNGAEENYLAGSHGFVTQHPWYQNVSMFVNLDGAGAGGREILFRSGPDHHWMLKKYLESVPHPVANVFAQEYFELGAIPSETDFRIFQDFGNISGLDIVSVKNGNVYHTEQDSMKHVSKGSLLKWTENLLSFLDHLLHLEKNQMMSSYPKEETPVFFDFLGTHAIIYSAEMAVVLNLSTISVTIPVICFKCLWMSCVSCKTFDFFFTKALYMLLARWASLIQSFLLVYVTAYTLEYANATMSWYNNSAMIFPLHVVPYIVISVYNLSKVSKEKAQCTGFETKLMEIAIQAEFSFWLAIGTYCGIKTCYCLMLFLLFHFIGDTLDCLLPLLYQLNTQRRGQHSPPRVNERSSIRAFLRRLPESGKSCTRYPTGTYTILELKTRRSANFMLFG